MVAPETVEPTETVVITQDCYFNGEYRNKGAKVKVSATEKRNLEACGYVGGKKVDEVVTQSVDSTPNDRQMKTKKKR